MISTCTVLLKNTKVNNVMPKVSIIVPCYLQAQFLNDCLTSVVNQTFTDWECIIVNDGSTDNTDDVVKNFLQNDVRFIYKKTENKGVSAARNTGIKMASGTFILPLDGDDSIHEKYLEKAIEQFDQKPSTTLVYCRATFFGEAKGEWKLPTYAYKRILRENIIFCSCIFYKEKALEIGLYDESMHMGLEDWEFLLRLLDEHSIVHQLDEILFNYRIKKNSRSVDINTSKIATVQVREMVYKQRPEVYKKYYGDFVSLVYEHELLKEKVEIFKTYKPNRNFKNLIKFFKKEQMFTFEDS
jgi:glycosyltransferase involved in cell wall biosynthesis